LFIVGDLQIPQFSVRVQLVQSLIVQQVDPLAYLQFE
jgi:hypothetical protein